MNYYIYKITNQQTNDFYIGKRRCECDIYEDDYMGSGINLHKQYNKFSKDCFKKEILATCQSDDELTLIEGAYINHNIINDKCLNLATGKTISDERILKDNARYKGQIKRLTSDVDFFMTENYKLEEKVKSVYELKSKIDDLEVLNESKRKEINSFKKGLTKQNKRVSDKIQKLESYVNVYENNKDIIDQLKERSLHNKIIQSLNIDSKNSISEGDIVRHYSDDCLFFVREVKEDCVELVFNLCQNSDFEQTRTLSFDELNRLSIYKLKTND